MQLVVAWVVGSPVVAVLVGKMISFGDRVQVSMPPAAAEHAVVGGALRHEAAA